MHWEIMQIQPIFKHLSACDLRLCVLHFRRVGCRFGPRSPTNSSNKANGKNTNHSQHDLQAVGRSSMYLSEEIHWIYVFSFYFTKIFNLSAFWHERGMCYMKTFMCEEEERGASSSDNCFMICEKCASEPLFPRMVRKLT